MARSDGSTLAGLRRKAQREGWAGWIRSDADERAVLDGHWFDQKRAERVVTFFATFLRHSKGRFAGRPFDLLDWQRDRLIMPLFGWVRRDEFGDVVRRFNKVYCELPKKQGKSTLAAALAVYMLTGDGEGGAEVYSAAIDRPQSLIVTTEAMNMVEASPDLAEVLNVNRSTHRIYDAETKSWMRALSGDDDANEGYNASCIVADELHKWRGRKLYEALQYAFANRSQPLFFQITTAGDDPQSVAREQHEYAKGVIEGRHYDPRFLGLIYAADEKDDPWSEATWRKANPSLGVTVSVKSMAEDATEAKRTPRQVANWKQRRLNIWTTGEAAWLNSADWDACRGTFTPDDLDGQTCYAALDLSRTRDSSSLSLVFPWDDDRVRLRVLTFFWLPRARAQELDGRIAWLQWGKDGHAELIDGEVIEFSFIERKFAELAERYAVQELAFDPRFAEETTFRMERDTGVQRVAFAQSWNTMPGPTAELKRLILSRGIEHNGNPVMDWQVGNAAAKTAADGSERVFKRRHNDPRGVDGVVATVMGIGRWMASEGAEGGPSMYEGDEGEVPLFL